MKTRIHVNQHNIKANAKGAELPVISCKTYKDNRLGNTAIIRDAQGNEVCRVVYQPDNPLSCGARVWIETECDVEVTQ
jgi:hypothetical protein